MAWRACLTLTLIALGGMLAIWANEPVSIQSREAYAYEPVDWYVTIRVEPNAANRLLVVEADGTGEYRRSDYQLEGEKAATIRQVLMRTLRAGCYWFSASVYGSRGELGRSRAGPLHVLGPDGDACPSP